MACECLKECIRLMNICKKDIDGFTKLLYESATVKIAEQDEDEDGDSQIVESGLDPTQRADEMMTKYRQLVDALIGKSMLDEAVVFLSIMNKLSHLCSQEAIRSSDIRWIQSKSQKQYNHTDITREIVSLCCSLNARLGDLEMIKQLASDIRCEVGMIEPSELYESQYAYLISIDQGGACGEALLKCLDSIIEFLENEWERFTKLRDESRKTRY
jgi:hypothetical protein